MRLNLSYSSLSTLHECARKYELEKMIVGEGIRESSLDLAAGKSFDAGISAYWETQSFEHAVAAAYFAWTFPDGMRGQTFNINDTKNKKGKVHKAFYLVVAHLEMYSRNRPLENLGYKLWTLPSGRPATQVGFKIKLPNNKFYRGFIDAIMQNDSTDSFAAIEVKTSGFKDAPRALYQNSFQGISYSFITDYLTQRNNPIQYNFVAEFPEVQQQLMDFYRNPYNKVSWLPKLAFDCSDLDRYIQHEHFPMNGASCYNYFRDCAHLGTCDLARTSPYIEHKEEPDELYDFNFTLEELLEARSILY